MNSNAHVDHEWLKCPYCRGDEVTDDGDFEVVSNTSMTLLRICSECLKVWKEVWVITGYVEVDNG